MSTRRASSSSSSAAETSSQIKARVMAARAIQYERNLPVSRRKEAGNREQVTGDRLQQDSSGGGSLPPSSGAADETVVQAAVPAHIA